MRAIGTGRNKFCKTAYLFAFQVKRELDYRVQDGDRVVRVS